MSSSQDLQALFQKYQGQFAPVVAIDFQQDACLIFDFSVQNKDLDRFDLTDVQAMNAYVFGQIKEAGAKVGLGGYNEERAVYQKSQVFDAAEGSRSIHLGIDIWLPAGSAVFAPCLAKVHSFQNNDNFGDYGPTIILEHSLENHTFYTLYGHLSLESLDGLRIGKEIQKGEKFAEIGDERVNGHWTPHLHFQIIRDLLGKTGDFIGVAPKSQRDFYLDICPNPNWLLNVPAL